MGWLGYEFEWWVDGSGWIVMGLDLGGDWLKERERERERDGLVSYYFIE